LTGLEHAALANWYRAGDDVPLGRFAPPNLPSLNSEANAVAPMSRPVNTPPLFQEHHVAQLIERLAEPGCSAAARASGWDLVHQLRQEIARRVDEPAERTPRGRNQFTKAALGRTIDIAREKGIDRIEVELPGGGRFVLPVSKQDKQTEPDHQKNEWDEMYGTDPAETR
jgi:hypothetical protein